jgi:hypothetical protein
MTDGDRPAGPGTHDAPASAPSTLARTLPAALLLVAMATSLWTIPALIRTAERVRTERDVEDARERLAATDVLAAYSRAARDVARAVEPAVVHVSVAGNAKGRLGARAFTQSGSGWVWDADGHVVTNAHVVDSADELEVQLHDGSLHGATLVGLDPRTDVPRFGAYRGAFTHFALDASLRERATREKRWIYITLVKAPYVIAVAIMDLGYVQNAFAFVFETLVTRAMMFVFTTAPSGTCADTV